MRDILRKMFWPILKFFEGGGEPTNYKKSHRVALNILGGLFILLSFVSAAGAYFVGGAAAFIPVIVFFGVGFVACIVGTLGSDFAVSKIWGTK